jgi:LytS/YehU family sensor histidine kinase
MFKSNYQKIEEKQMLTIENKAAELQLLKAQVNPHFLFNTLNNIYSFTLNKSEQAGVLVKKLTSVFRYMTDDCDQALVPLDKELKMLQDYIGLEKVRYGNRISIEIEISGYATDKMITPLLMIPLIENSFKHGTSQMLNKPWIMLDIAINKNVLTFSLKNSRPLQTNLGNGKNGLGLKNVKKAGIDLSS